MLKEAVRHSKFTTIGALANAIIGLLFAGLTIRFLGDQRAGFLLLMQSLISISATTGGFGLGTSAVRRIAMFEGQGKHTEAIISLGVILSVSLLIGIVIAILLPLMFPWIFRWSKIEEIFRSDAFRATILLALTFLFQQITSAYGVVFPGMRRFDLVALLGTITGLFNGAGGLLILSINRSMTALAAASLATSIIVFAIEFYLTKRLLHQLILPKWNLAELRSMLRFGSWVYVEQIFSLFSGNLDRVILTTFLGSAVLPYYSIGQRVILQVHSLLAGQSQYLFPLLAAKGGNTSLAVDKVEDRLRWYIGILSAVIYGGLVIVTYPLLMKLIGVAFAQKASIVFILACTQGFLIAQSIIPYFISYGEGRAAPNTVLTAINGVLVIGTMAFIIPRLGVLGAGLAQLWCVLFSMLLVYWVDQAGGRFTWKGMFRPWISPLIIFGISIIIALGVWRGRYLGWLYYGGLGMMGYCVAVASGFFVEKRFYAKYMCLATLKSAFQITFQRFIPKWASLK